MNSFTVWWIYTIEKCKKAGDFRMIKQSSGNYNIIESGLAMTFGPEEGLLLNVNFDGVFEFSIDISFDDTEGDRNISVSVNEETNIISLIFMHYLGVIGYGIDKAIEVATFKGKKVFFRVWITPMGKGNKSKKIEYVFYKEK